MSRGLKALVVFLGVVIVALLGVLLFVPSAKGPTTGASPGAAAPAPAISADGHLVVDSPLAGSVISSPVAISGTVTGGGWFFEAVFPVAVEDANGAVLGRGLAHAGGAPGSWMTTGTVPFAGTIDFTATSYASGTVLFAKDNPSGDPANAGELGVPVRFK